MAKMSLHKIQKFVHSQGICFISLENLLPYATFLWSEPYNVPKNKQEKKICYSYLYTVQVYVS